MTKNRFSLKHLDMLSMPLPSFKIGGEEEIKTNIGAFFSVLLVTILFIYGFLKSVQLEAKANPNITTYTEANAWTVSNPIDLRDINFRAAFAFESFRD